MTIRLAAAILALSVVGQPAAAQTADDVLAKAVDALGGRDALQKLRSRHSTGTITLETPAGNVAGTVDVTNAAPNKSRTLIKADLTALGAGQLVIDQRFDGAKGYALDSLQGNREITGQQLDTMRNSAFPHPFLKYKDLGIAAKLVGRETVGGRPAFVIAMEPTSGPTVRQFIDAETYLPVQSVVKIAIPQLGQEVEQTTEFSDYRSLDGVKIPFQLHVSSSVQGFTIKLETVEHNVSVDETLFVKP